METSRPFRIASSELWNTFSFEKKRINGNILLDPLLKNKGGLFAASKKRLQASPVNHTALNITEFRNEVELKI